MASLVLSYTYISVNGLQSKFWFLSLLLFKTIDIKLKHERGKKGCFLSTNNHSSVLHFPYEYNYCWSLASCVQVLAGKVALAELTDDLSNSEQRRRLCYCPLDTSPPPQLLKSFLRSVFWSPSGIFRPLLRGHCTAGVCCELREAIVLLHTHSNRSAFCLYSSASYLQSNFKHIYAKIRLPTTTSIYTL